MKLSVACCVRLNGYSPKFTLNPRRRPAARNPCRTNATVKAWPPLDQALATATVDIYCARVTHNAG
jgi:hypothetical protein